MMRGATKLDEKAQANLADAINFLEGFLSKSKYAACDHLTIADIALVASASTVEVIKLYIRNLIICIFIKLYNS